MNRKRIFAIHVTTIATGRPSVVFNRRTRDGGHTTTRHYAIDRHDWVRPVLDRIKAVQPSHDVYEHVWAGGARLYTAIEIVGRHGSERTWDDFSPRGNPQIIEAYKAQEDRRQARRAYDEKMWSEIMRRGLLVLGDDEEE